MDIRDDVVALGNSIFAFHSKLDEATFGFQSLVTLQSHVRVLSELANQYSSLYYSRRQRHPLPLPESNIFDGIFSPIKDSMNKIVDFCQKYYFGSQPVDSTPSLFKQMEILAEWVSTIKAFNEFLVYLGFKKE